MKIIIITIILATAACLLEANKTTVRPKDGKKKEDLEKFIEETLQERFKPKVLKVINECHIYDVPAEDQSYLKIIIVCDEFKGMDLIKRNRVVNKVLAKKLKKRVLALSMECKTEAEWDEKE